MNISGSIIYSPDSQPNKPGGNSVLSGIPVVLHSGEVDYDGKYYGIVALTNDKGEYLFTDVSKDKYFIVEAAGYQGVTQTTASWDAAEFIRVIPADPSITAVTSPPAGANALASISPNTLVVTVTNTTEDLTDNNFYDVPIRNIELALNTYVTTGFNLISAAELGTFGFYLNGTPVQTSNITENPPYSDFTTDFSYVQYGNHVPINGQYSISNTITNSNFDTWFNVSDHSKGDEAGRMMIVNGEKPDDIVFGTDATVTADSDYVFSAWVMNVDSEEHSVLPEFRVTIKNDTGDILYNQILTENLPVTEIPTWVQIGAVFNSGSNTNLNIMFISEGENAGENAGGNAYLIDDIALFQLEPAPVTDIQKEVDKSVASAGDILTYTVTFTNSSQTTSLTEVTFMDPAPEGTTIIPDSLVINQKQGDESLLVTGVPLDDIPEDSGVQITFQVRVNADVVSGTVINNSGQTTYDFVDSQSYTRTVTTTSNTVQTVVINSVCEDCQAGPAGPPGETATQNYLQVSALREQYVGGKRQMNLGNVITQAGFTIVYNPSNREILLQRGSAYYVSYKIVVEACNCRSRINVITGIQYQNMIYPGSISTDSIYGTGTVELSASVIISTDGRTERFSIVNMGNNTINISSITLNVIQLA